MATSPALSISVKAAACNMASLIIWRIAGGAPSDAQGVRITHIAADGTRTVLPNSTPFPGSSGSTQPSDVWPIQRRGHYFHFFPPQSAARYEVALMVGSPGSLKPLSNSVGLSNTVTPTTQLSQFVAACFNWGILSTQYISAWIKKNCPSGALESVAAGQLAAHAVDSTATLVDPDKTGSVFGPLVKACSTPGNELRERLAAGLIEFAKGPLNTAAAEGGHIYDASYEVTDSEWIDFLTAHPDTLSIILADIGKGNSNENARALAALKATSAEVFNRKLKSGYATAHNKSQVRTDARKTPQEYCTGAHNKTTTGFCGQVSNAVRILSQAVAAQGLQYWQMLHDDTVNHDSSQGSALREWCNKLQPPVTLPDGTTVQLIFAPNNLSADKPSTGLTPGMEFLSKIIDELEEGDVVAGNFFIPGHPSVVDMLAAAKIAKPGIVMKIAVSDKSALPLQMPPTPEGEDPVFVVAQPIKSAIANLLPEILGLPGAHAYIHSKDFVIYKAKTRQWIVVTGSHNLGEKADADNDDTIIVITGCTLLGLAYFVNNFSVYDHFLFREMVNSGQVGTGYLVTDGSWQTMSDARADELEAIMQALSSGQAVAPPQTSAEPVTSSGSSGNEPASPERKHKRKPPTKRAPQSGCVCRKKKPGKSGAKR